MVSAETPASPIDVPQELFGVATESGPLARITLFASGVDRRVLSQTPGEQIHYQVLGTTVLLTAAMATCGGGLAASYALYGAPRLKLGTVVLGLLWGTFIFLFDRAIAKSDFNPYQFAELQDVGGLDSRVSRWRRLQKPFTTLGGIPRGLRVVARGWLRIGIAICTSYLIAQFVGIAIFNTEVSTRVDFIVNKFRDQQEAIVRQNADRQTQAIAAQIAALRGSGDPRYGTATQRIAQLTQQLNKATADAQAMYDIAAKEADGVRGFSVTLSNGKTFRTSNKGPGAGDQYRAFELIAQQLQQHADSLQVQLRVERSQRQEIAGSVTKSNGRAIESLENTTRRLRAGLPKAIERARARISNKGILIRMDALSELRNDRVPETPTIDPFPSCARSSLGWACSAKNWLFPPTPLGGKIGVLVVLLFLIEIFPVSMKIGLSLRRRRPYDALRAALEESGQTKAVDVATATMVHRAATIEQRTSAYRVGRIGTAAEFELLRRAITDAQRRGSDDIADALREAVRAQAGQLRSIEERLAASNRAAHERLGADLALANRLAQSVFMADPRLRRGTRWQRLRAKRFWPLSKSRVSMTNDDAEGGLENGEEDDLR